MAVVRTKKEKIPKALREQVWRSLCGEVFQAKCNVVWCTNVINVFDFEVGHNIPESKGGTLRLDNLRPICVQCNRSMSNHYTIDEWNKLGAPKSVEIVARPVGRYRHALVANVLATTPAPVPVKVQTAPVVKPSSYCCWL